MYGVCTRGGYLPRVYREGYTQGGIPAYTGRYTQGGIPAYTTRYIHTGRHTGIYHPGYTHTGRHTRH